MKPRYSRTTVVQWEADFGTETNYEVLKPQEYFSYSSSSTFTD
jgi:hypothetical protein